MLKFVSTKPPKGGESNQTDDENRPRKKKGSFRWKIFSKRENPQTFDKDVGKCEANKGEESADKMDRRLGDYDNYDSSTKKELSQKIQSAKNSNTRTWSVGSESSIDSNLKLPIRKHGGHDPFKGQGHHLRHVTWSPDVTDGSENGFSFDIPNGIGSEETGQHEDYYWDNLESLNSSHPFKLHHQGTCALNSHDGPFYQSIGKKPQQNMSGPLYQTITKKTPPLSSPGHSRPQSKRLEYYPRDQFVHHVGKPIFDKKFEMYPSVTLPHRSKSTVSRSVASNSYATVGPKTLKRNHINVPYSIPITSEKSTGSETEGKRPPSPREIPILPNRMRNFSVPYCVPNDPVSPREFSVNSKLLFSPSIYSTPKRNRASDMDMTGQVTWGQKPRLSTEYNTSYGDYERLSDSNQNLTRQSPLRQNPNLKPFLESAYQNGNYLDFIQNISRRYPHEVKDSQRDSLGFYPITNGYQQETSQMSTGTRSSGSFDDRSYDKHWSNYSEPEDRPSVMTSCVPQINSHDVKHETVNRYQYSTSRDQFSGTPGMSSSSTLRNMITRAQDHHGNREDDLVLDLVYITERIISMSFPSDGHETTYQYNLNEVMNMLKQKHGDNCMVINVSEQRPDLQKVTQRVVDYGWPAHLAPPLERLCNICKSMDSWLNSDPNHVAVVHCKGGQDRIAMVIAAFMHYCNICASSDQAMDRFAMKRFYDDKLGGALRPSQERYVQYFAGLLSGKIKINSNPLYLHHLVIHGVPNYDAKGGCQPFIRVYQGMQAIFTSGVYNVTDQMQKVCISISPGIPLRGDIMIKCFHKHPSGSREPMWTSQFHTCAISNMSVLFSKNELDEAKEDPRFPVNGKVEFVFGKSQDSRVIVQDFKSDVTVPVIDEDGLKRSDSYENFLRSGGVNIDGMIGNTSTSQYSTQVRSNEPMQQSYNTSTNTMKSSYSSSSTLPKKPATMDEQKELDMILSDLLNDQVFVSNPQSPPNKSNETRTYREYDVERSPDGKVLYRTAEANFKMPEQHQQQSYSYKTAHSENSSSKSYVPPNAFSYTPASPELARRTESSKTTTLPYSVRTDFQNGDQFSYSRSETDNSWLQQQQQKLRERKDSKSEERQMQERQLVDELRSAQNKYFTKRAQNEADEQAVMSSFQSTSPPPLSNGPTSGNYSYSMKKTHTYSTEKTPEPIRSYPGDSSYSTSTTSYRTESQSNKPPPSPGQTRTNIQINMPVSPPIRSSSKDFMQRTRTSSTSNSWQSSPGQSNLHRQNSDNTFDRQSEVILPPVVKTITITTPPQSRRSFSPTSQQSQQTSKKSYEIHQTIRDQSPDFTKSLPRYSPTKTKVTEIQETNHPDGDKKSHYITEVYVHRTAGDAPSDQVQHHRTKSMERTEKTEVDKSRSLDELERSLQAASNSIIATKPSWQVQNQQQTTTGNQGFQKIEQTQRVTRKYETRTYETHNKESQRQEVQPRPKHINVVEEDRFSLRPIGPGMQPLEPEGIQTGTLPRSTTPSFPVSPVASADAFDKIEDTSHQQNQQQQQQIQHTEHREYKYNTQNFNYNQQPNQQFMTGSQQHINMTEGMPAQNIPIQHQQGGSQFNTMSSGHGSVSSPQGFNTLGSNQSYRTEQHQKYHTMSSSGSHDGFGTMGSQNFGTMSSGHGYNTMGSQQNGSLHVDTTNRSMHSGPSSAGSPHSPDTLNALRQQLHVAHNMSSSSGGALSPGPHSMTGQSSPSVYFGMSRRGSLTSLADTADAVHATPKFVKNTSKYWYMPNITREEAISMLKDKAPGTFVVRDSNSFPGAFGLALKVATIPPNVQTKSSGDPAADLVRHFLIEPTPKGVRLRGCSNEPVFGSLASLVYQHSITPLALPCKLVLPEVDPSIESSMDVTHTSEQPSSAAALLAQGAACNVLYINSIDTESLTGPQAVARALKLTFDTAPSPTTTVVHFKVSNQGITLTDNQRKLFFRRHYPVSAVTYCGMDPESRKWKRDTDIAGVTQDSRVFGFVARKHSGASDNACHLFAELDPEQPASAIVNFVTKIMIGQGSKK